VRAGVPRRCNSWSFRAGRQRIRSADGRKGYPATVPVPRRSDCSLDCSPPATSKVCQTFPVNKKRRTITEALYERGMSPEAAQEALEERRVFVAGSLCDNRNRLVRADESVVVKQPASLRGAAKLSEALDAFDLTVADRVALDVGASTGGFTQTLLARGAKRVYAVDVGYGQLLGSLRNDGRVVCLERTNIAELSTRLVPEPIELATVDVGRLSLREAVRQLTESGVFAEDAEIAGLIKPMFELAAARLPPAEDLVRAVDLAVAGVGSAGWHLVEVFRSSVGGRKGAVEFFAHFSRGRT
jgi:23S rRNA (cytidine1920-2'-O)/16S rRNA (cytidine1409-2'-O)-methyltransferase